jgi:hypothetical protein
MTISKRLCSVATLVALAVAACEPEVLKPITPSTPPPDSPEAVVTVLERAYEKRSLTLLGSILAVDPARNAVFHFQLSEPTDRGELEWDHDEEVRIHSRMFRPADHVADPTPVPRNFWLRSVSVQVRQLEPFAEVPDFYSDDHGKDGKLDPALWKAVGARYQTEAFFDTAGDTDYQVDCVVRFVIIEDLDKRLGDRGKFLLYRWVDALSQANPGIGRMPTGAVAPIVWSSIKRIYR